MRPEEMTPPATTTGPLEPGQEVELVAGEVAHGGWCVARLDGPDGSGPVVFVRHTLPGEQIRARITEVTSKFARADAVEILVPAAGRVTPPCPYAHPGGCGGCDWQHAALPAQRELKEGVARPQLRRIADIEFPVVVESLPGDAPGDPDPGLGWRTRVVFAVRPDGVAGLRAHRSHRGARVWPGRPRSGCSASPGTTPPWSAAAPISPSTRPGATGGSTRPASGR